MSEITEAFDKIVKTIAEVDPEQEYIGPDDYVALFRSATEDYEKPWYAEVVDCDNETLRRLDKPDSFVEASESHAMPEEALEALEQVIREAYGEG